MTNKEAADFIWDVLDGVKSFNEEGDKGLEALDLAIKALKNERPQGEWIEFAEFVAKEVCTNNFKENADCFAELACRKLEKFGLVKRTESEWIKK